MPPKTSHIARLYAQNYFSNFGIAAFFIGFLPLHCQAVGLSPKQISFVLITSNLSTLIAAPLFAKRLGGQLTPRNCMRICAIGVAFLFIPLIFLKSFLSIWSTLLLAMFFWSGISILSDSFAIHESAGGTFRYERVRVWGSIGFIVLSYLFGFAIDWSGNGSIVALGCLTGITLGYSAWKLAAVLPIQELASTDSATASSVQQNLPIKTLLGYFLSVSLGWISHAALYVYLSLYLRQLGWSGQLVSLAWGTAVLAEVIMLCSLKHLELRFSAVTIVRMSLLIAIARWLLLGRYTDMATILFAQSLHAFTFGSFHVGSMKLIYGLLPDGKKVSGLALLTAWATAGGSIIGRIIVGILAYQVMTTVRYQELFLYSAGISCLALVATLLLPRNETGPHAC